MADGVSRLVGIFVSQSEDKSGRLLSYCRNGLFVIPRGLWLDNSTPIGLTKGRNVNGQRKICVIFHRKPPECLRQGHATFFKTASSLIHLQTIKTHQTDIVQQPRSATGFRLLHAQDKVQIKGHPRVRSSKWRLVAPSARSSGQPRML